MIKNDHQRLPLSGGRPKQLVVLLHGYGSNGKDLHSLSPYFQDVMPEAVFICPDAPFPCEMGGGFQWFSLSEYTAPKLLEGAQMAHPILNEYLDKLLQEFNLTDKDLALVGFSQGTMMSLYTGLRRKSSIAGVLGYSGAVIGADTPQNEGNGAQIMLIHGEDDSVVPVVAHHKAKEVLAEKGYKLSGHTTPGLGHSIDEEGIESGKSFLSEILNDNKSL